MTKRATRASEVPRGVRPRSRAKRRSVKKDLKTFLAMSFLIGETAVAIALVCALKLFYDYSTKLPRVEDLANDVRTPVATTFWSQDGVQLGQLEVENRQPVTLDEVPQDLINATIAIEDHRFYEHHGIDLQGIGRAAWANFRGSNLTGQGGSTLTQQLVRNLDQLGISREKRIERKVQEALIALRMEQVYTKKEILQMYLNNIYYGGGAYGIQAAAKTFFGKPAAKLKLSEAALLAGLPQRPTEFTPFEHRKAAIKRRDEVLDRMLAYGYITQPQYQKAIKEKPHISPRQAHRNFDFKAPYFTTYVLNDLVKRYGADFVYSGLKIETTLNWKQQQMAEKALQDGLANASGHGANQGALVAIDPNNGYIRAMVGGRDFHADQYNAVTQGRRQPGSTFKAFDYTAAFDTDTANLHSTYMDEPIPYPNDPKHRVVKNYSGGYSYHRVDCLSAIKHSMNTIAVQVAQDVGIKRVIEYAHKMGITTELAPYLPTALGASAVRPLDLCSAYTVFPMKGSRCVPMALVRITDAENNIIEEDLPQIKPSVLRPETVEQMDTAFEAVVTSGTGTLARGTEANGIVENARGKTGTTSDNRDAWFAGYTPELTTVIWVASVHRHKNKIAYYEMPGATGGHQCAPIWHNFMIQAVPEERKFRSSPQNPVAIASARDPFADKDKNKEADKKKSETHHRVRLTASEQKDGFKATTTPDTPPVTADPATNNTDTNTTPAPPANTDNSDTTSDDHADTAPPPSRPVTSATPNGGMRAAAPTERPSTAVMRTARPPALPEMVTVRVCVDTGALATDYCDATKLITVTRRQARRMHHCRLHRPPSGEE